jgi:hypothetical protein
MEQTILPDDATESTPTTLDQWEAVTDDGGVKKQVIKEGVGEKPSLHSRCLGKAKHRLLSC